MKKLLFTITLSLIISCSFAQWEEQDQIPDSVSLMDVFFVNDSCGWVVGNDRSIIKTTNAGITWIDQSRKRLDNYYYAVFFIDENLGWIAGYTVIDMGGSWGKILHTTNGGDTWEEQLSSPRNSIHDICFIDSNHGFAVSNAEGFFQTDDSGENWVNEPDGFANLRCIFISNEFNMWAGGLQEIYYSNDGGDNWATQLFDPTMVRFHDIYFSDSLHGWAVGELEADESGIIYSTDNGGQLWNMIGITEDVLNGVFFVDNNVGWIVGRRGIIKYTTDGGDNWHDQSIPDAYLQSIFITDSYQGWIAGGGKLYHADLSTIIGLGDYQVDNLMQVNLYPNPFTTSITIEYELLQPDKVSLTIYNHLGQLVYQTEENQPQGLQQLIWNAERFAEGVYYYRLQIGDVVANGKMVKVR